MDLRPLATVAEYRAAVALQQAVWGEGETTPANQLIATNHSGGLVLGAFSGADLIGFALAWPGRVDGEPLLYSHMLAVRPDGRGAGVGRALKWWQREWALAQGYTQMAWTYDPLRRLNAAFNLNLLGAQASRLILNCYGEMGDSLNWGLESDRFWVEWHLEDQRVVDLAKGRSGESEFGEGIWVEIPKDVEALKAADLGAARELQAHFRLAVAPLFAAGLRALAIRDRGEASAYLFSRR